MTMLSFAAVFAALGLGTAVADRASVAWVVVGVLIGSATWWLILSLAVGGLRSRFDVRALRGVNRPSGMILVAFGVAGVASAWGVRP